jgi:hypothetical protein
VLRAEPVQLPGPANPHCLAAREAGGVPEQGAPAEPPPLRRPPGRVRQLDAHPDDDPAPRERSKPGVGRVRYRAVAAAHAGRPSHRVRSRHEGLVASSALPHIPARSVQPQRDRRQPRNGESCRDGCEHLTLSMPARLSEVHAARVSHQTSSPRRRAASSGASRRGRPSAPASRLPRASPRDARSCSTRAASSRPTPPRSRLRRPRAPGSSR